MQYTDEQIQAEVDRLYKKLEPVGFSKSDLTVIAPLTLEINALKKEQDAIILAHSYQTPDIVYGVADFIGDSYGLSIAAKTTKAKKIIFSSVHFMAETAKLLNPEKEVLVPAEAGCSLAESITPEDIRNLRKEHPNAGVVCYVNTTAAVKAECDSSCTSSNVMKVIEGMPQDEIIFVPDEFMAKNITPLTKKKIIGWKGRCIVHEEFSPETVAEVRQQFPGVKILAHTECSPAVIEKVDMAGGTKDMIEYIETHDDEQFMLVTECGMVDRMKVEYKDKKMVGACAMCPFMKKIMLKDILVALKDPRPDQIVDIPEEIADKARANLEKMIELTEQ